MTTAAQLFEGFGSETVGGRGGQVVHVTTLDDHSYGSLRWAIEEIKGPKTIVFDVAGDIVLDRELRITDPNVTIAGQSAPSTGVTITGARLNIQASEVIVQGLKFRPGDTVGSEAGNYRDGISIGDGVTPITNIVIDHNSITWAVDESLSIKNNASNVVISNNLIAEGLNYSIHPFGGHSKGLMVANEAGQEGVSKVTLVGNLFAHNVDRNPYIRNGASIEIINNYIYDPGSTANVMQFGALNNDQRVLSTLIAGNVIRFGPSTLNDAGAAITLNFAGDDASYVINDNLVQSRGGALFLRIGGNVAGPGLADLVLNPDFATSGIMVMSSGRVAAEVLLDAGAMPAARDTIDQRIVSTIVQGTGAIINSPSEVGGLLGAVSFTLVADSDRDGVPDIYENAYGSNPFVHDSTADINGNGVTNIEEYLIARVAGGDTILVGLAAVAVPIEVAAPGAIVGTIGNDSLIGTSGSDEIRGLSGSDKLIGAAGDDILVGGAGQDQLDGGQGADIYLVSGTDAEFDTIRDTGSAGIDILRLVGVDPVIISNFGPTFGIEVVDGRGAIFGNASSNTLDFSSVQFVAGGATVDGRDGDDIIVGTDGWDILYGSRGNDRLVGGAGNDILNGGFGNDQLIGGSGDDLLVLGPGQDSADGGQGGDVYRLAGAENITANIQDSGSEGADRIVNMVERRLVLTMFLATNGIEEVESPVRITGDDNANILDFSKVKLIGSNEIGGAGGNDIIHGTNADDRLLGEYGNDTLWGRDGNDALIGGSGDDMLYGGIGDDIITPGSDIDFADGGEGSDTYILSKKDDEFDIIVDSGATGIDRIVCSGDGYDFKINGFAADAGIEEVEVLQPINGNNNDNTYSFTKITVVGELDLRMAGGNDQFYGSNSAEIVSGGSGNDYISGRGGSDRLSGDAGDDILSGGAGDDTLDGGVGIDVVLLTGNATNYVIIGDLTNHVEVRDVRGAAYDGTDILTNVEYLQFNDGSRLSINLMPVVVAGTAGNDTISPTKSIAGQPAPGAGADTLFGFAGNDLLDGGAGADVMVGGAGNDTYLVDDVGDIVNETDAAGVDAGGLDTVKASVNYIADPFIEYVLLQGERSINATGNELANKLYGNAGSNVLSGEGGNDNICGATGNDILLGGDGNDLLDGGMGADLLYGGAGNDTYVVDDAGDVVCEEIDAGIDDGGIDMVKSNVSFQLGSFIEALLLTGTDSIDGVGNSSDNTIIGNGSDNSLSGLKGNDKITGGSGDDQLFGNEGNDVLDGGIGADVMVGGSGDDSYIVDNIADIAVEVDVLGVDSGGVDNITSAVDIFLPDGVEYLRLGGLTAIFGGGNALANSLVGNAAANVLCGFDGNDRLVGGDGSDVLDGGRGIDQLSGGLGPDQFLMRDIVAGEIDRIGDFNLAEGDRIVFESEDFRLTPGHISSAQLSLTGASTSPYGQSQFVFSAKAGSLAWDADGIGGAAPIILAYVQAGAAFDLSAIILL